MLLAHHLFNLTLVLLKLESDSLNSCFESQVFILIHVQLNLQIVVQSSEIVSFRLFLVLDRLLLDHKFSLRKRLLVWLLTLIWQPTGLGISRGQVGSCKHYVPTPIIMNYLLDHLATGPLVLLTCRQRLLILVCTHGRCTIHWLDLQRNIHSTYIGQGGSVSTVASRLIRTISVLLGQTVPVVVLLVAFCQVLRSNLLRVQNTVARLQRIAREVRLRQWLEIIWEGLASLLRVAVARMRRLNSGTLGHMFGDWPPKTFGRSLRLLRQNYRVLLWPWVIHRLNSRVALLMLQDWSELNSRVCASWWSLLLIVFEIVLFVVDFQIKLLLLFLHFVITFLIIINVNVRI